MKILLLGADGQLGSQLRRTLPALGQLAAFARGGADITSEAAIAHVVRESQPDVIVNAAAYTAVDRAESEPERAFAVNALACEALARIAEDAGAWLVHYSSDYVFDGTGHRPWVETDPPRPLSVYGASKAAGEFAIQAHSRKHLVLRTSWVFEADHANFIGAILKAACQRDSLTVVRDQWGTPTRARLIAQVTADILPKLRPELAGIYHLAAAGETSRFELARHAINCAAARGWPLRARAADIKPALTVELPSPAIRPLNSRLDCNVLQRCFHLQLPQWEDDVEQAIREWTPLGASLE